MFKQYFSLLWSVIFTSALIFSSQFSYANALTVDDFLAPADLLSAKLSPDGKHLVTVWNGDDQYRNVIVFDAETRKIVHRFGDNVVRPYSVSWANNERLLVKLLVPYDTSRVRNESKNKKDFDIRDYFMFGRIVSTELDGEGMVALMNDERSIKRNVNLANITHFLRDDPDHILMSATRKERLTLFKVNVNTGDSERVVTGGRFTVAFARDEEKDLLFRYDAKRIAKTVEIKQLDEKGDWLDIDTIYFDEDEQDKNKFSYKDLAGIKDGFLVYRKKNEETGYHELVTIKEGNTEVLVSIPNTDIVSVITSGLDSEVVGYTTLTDVYRSNYFDEKSQKIYDGVSSNFADENFSFSSLSEDKTKAVIRSWGASNPRTFYSYNVTEKKLERLNYAFSTLPKEKLSTGIKVQYLTRDKKPIDAYIYLPPSFDGTAAYPLVIQPHGGPQSRTTLNYSDFTQFISTRGYLVFQPNFRGSTGYGKDFEEAGYKEWGGVMQEDLEDAVAFLVGEGLALKDKVCIVGGSYGGYAALMGTVKTPDMFQCAVSINGVTHLPKQVDFDLDKFESEYLLDYVVNTIGHPEQDAEMLKARSPALHADKIKASILLIHGDKDKVVPYSQAKVMAKALKKNEKNYKFITLEETGHSAFRYEEDVELIYNEVEAFLAKHLKTQANAKKGEEAESD